MKRLVSVLMMVTMVIGAQAALVDGGFETTAPGIIPDGSDQGQWASWNGNFEVGSVQVRSGSQSALIGAKDLVNVTAGDKYSNLRQYEQHAEGLDNTQWTASAWFYYDSTQAGNGAETDAFEFIVRARDFWNTAVVSGGGLIQAADLVDGQWNYVEVALDVPVQVLDPSDPDYANKFRQFVGIEISQNGWIGHTGDFYVDDVTFAQVPEPMTLALLGLGGLLLRRRQMK